MTFSNEVTVSLQWGPNAYTDIRELTTAKLHCSDTPAQFVEVGVWNRDGRWLKGPGWTDSDVVRAFVPVDDIPAILAWAAGLTDEGEE